MWIPYDTSTKLLLMKLFVVKEKVLFEYLRNNVAYVIFEYFIRYVHFHFAPPKRETQTESEEFRKLSDLLQ